MEGEGSASRPSRFTPEEGTPKHIGYYAGWAALEKREILPLPGIKLLPSSPLPVVILTELSMKETSCSVWAGNSWTTPYPEKSRNRQFLKTEDLEYQEVVVGTDKHTGKVKLSLYQAMEAHRVVRR
jgi:hypothetical protein